MTRAPSLPAFSPGAQPFVGRSRLLVSALVLTAVGALGAAALLSAPPEEGDTQVLAATEPAEPETVPAASADDEADESEANDEDAAAAALAALRTIEIHVDRDPFEPVRPEPAADDEPADPSLPDDPVDPSEPDPPGNGDPSPVPPPAGDGTTDGRCVDQAELVCGGQVVEVQETTADGATIIVGGTVYRVSVSERFAEDFVLTAIDASGCAIIEYRGQTVRGCPGEPGTLK